MGLFNFLCGGGDPYDKIPDEDFDRADRVCSREASQYDDADQSAAVYGNCMADWMDESSCGGDDD